MKKISIKTVDGGRFDFIRENDEMEFSQIDEEAIKVREGNREIIFFRRNIVSIVKRFEED